MRQLSLLFDWLLSDRSADAAAAPVLPPVEPVAGAKAAADSVQPLVQPPVQPLAPPIVQSLIQPLVQSPVESVDQPSAPELPSSALTFVRSPRARRYILRVMPDGTARVTIPRRGSRKEAERFADAQQDWIARQRERRREQARHPARRPWQDGDTVLFLGQPTLTRHVRDAGRAALLFGDRLLPHDESKKQPWLVIRDHLRREATRLLPPRLLALAAEHGLKVTRVTIRNQRSRWGSCSSSGAISLNWRLIQMPDRVRDYVLLHELMHLRQPNHSRRFWRLVADVCPDFQESRGWLRAHESLLTDPPPPPALP
jgi:predicted metal-dependent hydrolase